MRRRDRIPNSRLIAYAGAVTLLGFCSLMGGLLGLFLHRHRASSAEFPPFIEPLFKGGLAFFSIGCFWLIAIALKAVFRSARGRCRNCGYDLRTSPERCPECGTAVNA